MKGGAVGEGNFKIYRGKNYIVSWRPHFVGACNKILWIGWIFQWRKP